MEFEAVIAGARAAWRGKRRITVLDSCFDVGERFLMLWDAWRADPQRASRLHVVALAGRLPDSTTARARLHGSQPRCTDTLMQALVDQWPPQLPGMHRLEFEAGAVTLTLGVGPAASRGNIRARIDHVLGGPEAVMEKPAVSDHEPPWGWEATHASQAIVAGAGLAGLCVARALARRGWEVTVMDPGWGGLHPAPHDGHVAAALTPVVSRDDNSRARLSRAGALSARRAWQDIPEPVVTRCGAIQLQRAAGRVVDLAEVAGSLNFSPDWVRYVNARQASEIAGIALDRPGLHFPMAMRVQVQPLLRILAATPGVRIVPAKLHALRGHGGEWQALDHAGQVAARASQVVIACAAGARDVLQASTLLPEASRIAALHALAGEITMIPALGAPGALRCIVSGDGYVLPPLESWCVTGGTYVHGAARALVTRDGQLANLGRAQGLLGKSWDGSALRGRIAEEDVLPGWAGWRAVLPGRLPAIGPIAGSPGLWVATGFASRGLTWSSLAGELIGASLAAEPLIAERDLLAEISPN